jgi:hypothetical protein
MQKLFTPKPSYPSMVQNSDYMYRAVNSKCQGLKMTNEVQVIISHRD